MKFQLQRHSKDPDHIEATFEFKFYGKPYICLAFTFHHDTLPSDDKILKALEDGKTATVEMELVDL